MSLPEIPGYTLLRPLGEGGMATVYLALQHSFGREVALKLMSPAVAAIPEFGERFQREAHIVARLVHPNIVSVHDVGIAAAGHYLSMEYVPGCDLGHAAEGLDMGAILRLLREVAGALHFAGRKGVVHRDVKPENILLHAEDGRAILTDFGIAHAADRVSTLTRAGTAVGTPHYMSPEQARGLPVDHRSDLYSLGVLLYLLLMGRVPFDAESPVAVGLQHVSAALPLLPPELAALQGILDRLLAKEPAQRFQDGGELAAALQQLPPDAIASADAFLARRRWHGIIADAGTALPPAAGSPRQQARWLPRALLAAGVATLTVWGIWQGPTLWRSQSGAPPVVSLEAVADPADPHIQGLRARAEVLEAALQAGWQDGMEAELVHLYRDWLLVDADAEPVRVALMRLQRGALERLQSQAESGDRTGARQRSRELAQRFPALVEAPGFQALQRELEDAPDWLALARERLARGQLSEPAGESAFDALQPLLAQAPDHPGAQQVLGQIGARYLALAHEQQRQGNGAAARQLVEAGLKVRPGDAGLRQLHQVLIAAPGAAAATAVEASYPADTEAPRVMAVAVSDKPDGGGVGIALSPGRTLYVAFEYIRFAPSATVLQALLFDGARSTRIASVPVVVSGDAGVQRFRIDRPVYGFASGGYHLDLMAGDLLLASAEFVVRNSD